MDGDHSLYLSSKYTTKQAYFYFLFMPMKRKEELSLGDLFTNLKRLRTKEETMNYLVDVPSSIVKSIADCKHSIQALIEDGTNKKEKEAKDIKALEENKENLKSVESLLNTFFEIFEGQLLAEWWKPYQQLSWAINKWSGTWSKEWEKFVTFLKNPSTRLVDVVDDERSQQMFSAFIKENWINDWKIHLSDLEKEIAPINKTTYVESIKDNLKTYLGDENENIYNNFCGILDQKLIEGLAPGYKGFLDALTIEAKKASQDQDVFWNAGKRKEEGISMIEEITNNGVTGEAVDILQKWFEDFFDGKVSMVIGSVLNGKFSEKVQACEDMGDMNAVISSDLGKELKNKINLLIGDESKDTMTKLMENIIKERSVEIKSNLPRLKTVNNMLYVGKQQYPVFISWVKKKTPVEWTKESASKEGVYAHHLREKNSGKIREISTRMMEDKDFFSSESFKKYQEENKEYKKYVDWDFKKNVEEFKSIREKIDKLREKSGAYEEIREKTRAIQNVQIDSTQDKKEYEPLSPEEQSELDTLLQREKELKKDFSDKIPKIVKYINGLNALQREKPFPEEYLSNDQRGMKKSGNLLNIPGFNSNVVKITEHMIEIMEQMINSMISQTIRQDGITILEWEAGVGKNVYIDTLAHFLKRPVFIFACNRTTDKQDTTFAYEFDKNGTYKVPSIVYEAIMTPGAILVFDEINTLPAEVVKQLNPLFDYRRSLKMPHINGPEKADPSVMIFGTMNPKGYGGTQQLPQDTASRADFIYAPYESFMNPYNKKIDAQLGKIDTNDVDNADFSADDEVNFGYGEALKMRWNINFFWKLRTGSNWTKEQVFAWEAAKLKEKNNQPLTEEEQKLLADFPKRNISDQQFVWARNQCFNTENEQEVIDKYGKKFVEGLKDIYILIMYANYIRIRYQASMENRDSGDTPWWDEDTKFTISASPRLLYQMLLHVHHGTHPKKAFMEVYLGQISDATIKKEIRNFFNETSWDTIVNTIKEVHVEAFKEVTEENA